MRRSRLAAPRLREAVIIAAMGSVLLSSGAASSKAAEPGGSRAAVLQALTDCRKLTEDAARLACYDKAAGAFDQAESQGQVVVIDREQAKAVRRQAFGFNLPTLHIFDRAAKNEEGVDHLELKLDSVHHDNEGHWVFVAADGAVWRQTDTQTIVRDPHSGSKLLIKSGFLGSYFCKVDGQPQVRCQRVS